MEEIFILENKVSFSFVFFYIKNTIFVKKMYNMLTEEIKIKNLATFKRYLKNLIGENCLQILLDSLGGDEKIMNASFGMNDSSGLAYDGAMIEQSLKIGEYATSINELLPKQKQVEPFKIWKVSLLSHISKVIMYTVNTDNWSKNNRGIKYVFTHDSNVVLKGGELSSLLVMNAGIKLSNDEYEAIRIIDKIKEDDSSARWGSCTLSMIIRQANEIITNINRVD